MYMFHFDSYCTVEYRSVPAVPYLAPEVHVNAGPLHSSVGKVLHWIPQL